MRASGTHELANAIAELAYFFRSSLIPKVNDGGNSHCTVVIDGGWLLHTNPWMKKETYE